MFRRTVSHPVFRLQLAVFAIMFAGIIACAESAHAATIDRTCPVPAHSVILPSGARAYVPAGRSDGCRYLPVNGAVSLPASATEVEVWSAPSIGHRRKRLAQVRDRYPGDSTCPQWAFAHIGGFNAGWVTCNGDVFNYGSHPLIVFFWRS